MAYAAPRSAGRRHSLDLFKTVLVLGMICAHVMQLISDGLPAWTLWFSDFINLISFSGFLLAFGYGLALPKRGKQHRSFWQRLRPVLAMLLAVYISSFGFLFLVEKEAFSPDLLRDVVTLRVLFGWSEFLASFFVLYLVIALFRPILLALAEEPKLLLALTIAGLASTLVTTREFIPLIGAVIGHTRYANFPLLSYLPWFLLGLYLGCREHKVDWKDLLVGLAATGAFALFFWRTGDWPPRFPPSALWVVGPGLFLLLYLWAAQAVERLVPAPRWTLGAGRHVLASLLLSNLTIFAIQYGFERPIRNVLLALGAGVLIFVGVSIYGAVASALRERSSTRGYA